jgi:pyrroloquinoline quinone (PQQ) biosynthesis protein C
MTVGSPTRSNTPTRAAPFFDQLQQRTHAERDELLAIPFVRRAQSGDVSLATYVAFLTQAYHHVKHTVPLLMAAGAALQGRHPWLLDALCEYVDEERGHDEWILADIAACGGDADAVRHGTPERACELLVAYAWDGIQRRDPVGFLGMVHVLEGTSVTAASQAAESIQRRLGLPDRAFTYLTTHGSLDAEHVGFYEQLVNRLDDPRERDEVVHCARVVYRLYGDVFRGLPLDGQEN